MFDFLFKRATKSTAVPPSTPTPASAAAAHAARDAARAQAEAIGQNEAACVEFLLTCEYADARLIAAQSIHSKEALQRVLKGVRNSDRRVARLMQSRLDHLQAEQHTIELATQCIADARLLTTQPQLTAQQVGAIDRRWSALFADSVEARAARTTAPSSELQQSFAAVRTMLAERLAQQVELQRSVIDTLAALQCIGQRSDAHASPMTSADLQAELLRHDAEITRYGVAFEVVNLPKNLLEQCRTALRDASDLLAGIQRNEAIDAAAITQLHLWESAPEHALDAATLQREWRSIATHLLPEDDLSARFMTLLARVTATKPVKAPVAPATPTVGESSVTLDAVAAPQTAPKEVVDALHTLEQALTQGQLQQALEADRRLRVLSKSVPESAAHKSTLAELRARLSQLQSWARWGGNVSRDELLKAATTLPAQNLSIIALAKKIGNLRAQWKAMDASAGPALQNHWHAFDAACIAAYAPVAAHHQALAEVRQKNSVAAHALIAALEQTADQLDAEPSPNWKAIAQHCRHAQQDWQRLGPTDRRDKQILTQRFQHALQRLSQPLASIQKIELQHREQLIAKVSQLQADDHRTPAALRALQQQWQEQAKAILLDRRDEQALWLRFRAACDAVFAQRKEQAVADDQLRQANLHERAALCSVLELAGTESTDALRTLLREVTAAWNAAGAVPRAGQDAIEQRYRQASETVKKNIDNLQRASTQVRRQTTLQKLRLCQRLEAALFAAADTTDATDAATANTTTEQIDALTSAWQALTATSTPLDHVLAQRFEQALQAQRIGDRDYLHRLASNAPMVCRELTRLEILLSLVSPPEQAAERLKLQVEVLQSALREGSRPVNHPALLAKLCALPALVDTATVPRFELVVGSLLDADRAVG